MRCECPECGCLDDAKRNDTLCAHCARSCKTTQCPGCNSPVTRRQANQGYCKACPTLEDPKP